MSTATNKKWYQSSGFWVGAALLIFSAWSGFTTETGEVITSMVLAVFGGIMAIYRLLKDGTPDWSKWLKNGNTWTYFTAVISAMFGDELVTLIPKLQAMVESISAGNFQAIITALISFGVSIYYFIRDRNQEPG